MLYRTDGPNEVVRFEGDYRPRQVDSADVVAPDASDPRGGWQTLLSNEDVGGGSAGGEGHALWLSRYGGRPSLLRASRTRRVATEFGPISYGPGDWVLLPKATDPDNLFRQALDRWCGGRPDG